MAKVIVQVRVEADATYPHGSKGWPPLSTVEAGFQQGFVERGNGQSRCLTKLSLPRHYPLPLPKAEDVQC